MTSSSKHVGIGKDVGLCRSIKGPPSYNALKVPTRLGLPDGVNLAA